jgi:hypothetical protein
VLAGFGMFKLFRALHPRFGSMKASWMDLAVWSMLAGATDRRFIAG